MAQAMPEMTAAGVDGRDAVRLIDEKGRSEKQQG